MPKTGVSTKWWVEGTHKNVHSAAFEHDWGAHALCCEIVMGVRNDEMQRPERRPLSDAGRLGAAVRHSRELGAASVRRDAAVITLDSSGMGMKVRCGACAPSSMPPPMNSVSLMSHGMRSCSTLR